MKRSDERAAWTAHVEGKPIRRNKYGAVRSGGYASKHEYYVASKLKVLEYGGIIWNLQEQVRFTLLEGRDKIRSIVYIADFVYSDKNGEHVCDAKGYRKNAVYLLKKKMMYLLLGIKVEEL